MCGWGVTEQFLSKQVLSIKDSVEIYSGQAQDGRKWLTLGVNDTVMPLSTSNFETHIPFVDAQNAFQKAHCDSDFPSIVSAV